MLLVHMGKGKGKGKAERSRGRRGDEHSVKQELKPLWGFVRHPHHETLLKCLSVFYGELLNEDFPGDTKYVFFKGYKGMW